MPSPPFANAAPIRQIWVSASAPVGGDGSAQRPFSTIQAGVNAATPGAAVMVKSGVYAENVKLPGTGGRSDAPIWLVSSDGAQAAHIVGAPDRPAIQGLGTDNYLIKNFRISGAYDGIQFSQSGRDFTNLVNNVVIQGNVITDVLHDGIKVGQADNVWILDNRVLRTRDEEGVDALATTNSVIARNEVGFTGSSAGAIVAKGGAFNVSIQANHVHHAVGDGISIGGNTEDQYFKPGFSGYEANEVLVLDNRVESAGKQPLSIRGAIHSEAMGNYLDASVGNGVGVYVTRGNPSAAVIAYSRDDRIVDNVLLGAKWPLRIDPGNSAGVVFENNLPAAWSKVVGPQPVALWPGQQILGSPGADSLGGTSGADTFAGGLGSDVYVINHPGDLIVERAGEGADVARTVVSHTLADQVESLIAVGTQKLLLTGNALDNSLYANSGGDRLAGLDGADMLKGGAGADSLDGGPGKDNLTGGAGADRLLGGAGQDRFIFGATGDFAAGGDVIVDYSATDYDRVDLSAMDANTTLAGDQAFRFIGAASFTGQAGELRAAPSATDLIVSGDLDGDALADISLRLLNVTKIGSNGFLL